MKFSSTVFLRSRHPAAIAAGILLGCAFPRIGIAGFGWITPGVLLAVALGTRGGESFRLGYIGGMAHYLTSLSWLLHIPVRGFPILGWVALSAFMALYPATWVWMAVRISGACGGTPGGPVPAENPVWSRLAGRSWAERTVWALGCAALWVAMEMILARFLGGFPWNLLGDSQYRLVPLIQIASITGVYGVSFLLVWSSVSLLNAVLAILCRPRMRPGWVAEIFLPMMAIAGVFAFGFHQLREAGRARDAGTIRLTLIQPSIPQTLIWDPSGGEERFRQLIRLSEQALSNRTDVLLWPEAAVPGFARWDTNLYPAITNLAARHQVWMILGSDDLARRADARDSEDFEYYNASFLVSPRGEFVNRYRKRSLVIFGEYIPFEHTLPFIKWFTPVTGSFTPGDRAVPFELKLGDRAPGDPAEGGIGVPRAEAEGRVPARDGRPIKTSVLICFEDNFPHLVRGTVEDDTDFLVNLTNNGWFGESAAQWQHAANAVFRAVENGLPLVRCTNNGLTCWIDAQGRLQDIFTDNAGTVHGPGYMTIGLPLPLRDGQRTETFYHRHGDWFGWSCLGLSALVVMRSRFHRGRES